MAARSWINIDGGDGIIAKKIVDQSVFKYGIHIPQEYREVFLKILTKSLEKGENLTLKLLIDDRVFQAKIWNIDEKKREDEVTQIRYDSNKELIEYLKEKFKVSYGYIIANKIEGSKKQIILPEDYEEFIEFYPTGELDTLRLRLITKEEKTIKEEFFRYVGPKDALENNKYQASYKMLLLLNLLMNCNDKGQAIYQRVCEDITSFYIDTYRKYGVAEAETIEIQKKIANLSVGTVKSIMNDNAYKVISEKGYIFKKNEGEELLCFNQDLWQELTEADKENLIEILDNKLKIYYEERINVTLEDEVETFPPIEDSIEIEDNAEAIKYIHKYISSKGYDFDEKIIKNYYLSLKTKPFVLLAGISGTGKSKLVRLFAEALGATSDNGRYSLIPVRPDWSDPSDLLGYKDIEGKFQPGPLTKIIKDAIEDNNGNPYFICLDEMNLARVEYYFSDILSIMETREKVGDRIVTDKIFRKEIFGSDIDAYKEYGNLYIPDNLYIIGTVNMDETTFPFSKKVLDRANTIEFNFVDLMMDFEETDKEYCKTLKFNNDRLASKYTKLKECSNYKKEVIDIIELLEKINGFLVEINSQFGYRIRDDISFYVLYALEEKLLTKEEAIDNAVNQKILPRIQGSNLRTKEVLLQLLSILADLSENKYDAYDNEVAAKLKKDLIDDNAAIKYKRSIEKIIRMIRRFDFDGFTAFWE